MRIFGKRIDLLEVGLDLVALFLIALGLLLLIGWVVGQVAAARGDFGGAADILAIGGGLFVYTGGSMLRPRVVAARKHVRAARAKRSSPREPS